MSHTATETQSIIMSRVQAWLIQTWNFFLQNACTVMQSVNCKSVKLSKHPSHAELRLNHVTHTLSQSVVFWWLHFIFTNVFLLGHSNICKLCPLPSAWLGIICQVGYKQIYFVGAYTHKQFCIHENPVILVRKKSEKMKKTTLCFWVCASLCIRRLTNVNLNCTDCKSYNLHGLMHFLYGLQCRVQVTYFLLCLQHFADALMQNNL